jgi:hypothetical protein
MAYFNKWFVKRNTWINKLLSFFLKKKNYNFPKKKIYIYIYIYILFSPFPAKDLSASESKWESVCIFYSDISAA